MRKKMLILLCLTLSITVAVSQNLIYAEYFFDTDPGLGNGTEITITPSNNLENVNFSASLAAFNKGFHYLYTRVKDENGKWSLTNVKSFYKEVLYDQLPDIVQAEYFINHDPGLGNAVQLAVTPAQNINNIPFTVDISALPKGFNHLYVRVKDENGKWSLTNVKSFYREVLFDQLSNIVQAEYFINQDPGLGNAVQLTVTPAQNINNIPFTVDISALPKGFNHLYVRVKDEKGKWSLTNVKSFYKEVLYDQFSNIVQAEYFINQDPGLGNAVQLTVTPAQNINNIPFTVDISTLPKGFNHLYVRVKDENGKWSLTNVKSFYREVLFDQLSNIVQAEYFINEDPGLGKAVQLPVTPSSVINNIPFNVDISALPKGFNHLYVRVKDEKGKWSLTNIKPFYKEIIYGSLADIVYAEYYIDNDPGLGKALSLPLTPSPNVSGISFTIDLSELANGCSHIFVRTKDQYGTWSLTNDFCANSMYGDVDYNGKVQAFDAAIVLQYSVGKDPIPSIDPLPWCDCRFKAADVDGSLKLIAYDAALILQYSIKKITTFPVQKISSNITKIKDVKNADVSLSIENNYLVLRSTGDVIGLNLDIKDAFEKLGLPENYLTGWKTATNITTEFYRVGMINSTPPQDESILLKIPILKPSNELIVKLNVNGIDKEVFVNTALGYLSEIQYIVNSAIRVYPNPVTEYLMIDHGNYNGENLHVQISNIVGQKFYSATLNSTNTKIYEFNNAPKGIYNLQVVDINNNIIHSEKIIKN